MADITPPPELVQQWCHDAEENHQPIVAYSLVTLLATRAAQWGADQELDACCEWLTDVGDLKTQLRAARRPKPQSLKEQALETLKYPKDFWSQAEVETIRRALEQLDD